ncbi:MAG: AAA family ATPase [Deltaproteobacteria bacterium]|nr:AAA family ATPase [Deltaproteobacteria bacterium]
MQDSDPKPAAPQSIAFAEFRLDLRGGQLTQAGRPIPLRPKTWAVLRYLVERPGVLVSRDELFDAVWPDVAVTPDTLTKSIGELRVALGEDARAPRFIETVHRRGFRFLDSRPAIDAVPAIPAGGAGAVVGRDAELGAMRAQLALALRGERQTVFVTGAAGIGKTTLVDTWLDRETAAHTLWVGRGTCVEQFGPREAYLPVLLALDRLARRPDAARFVELLRRTAPTWLAQLPWLFGDDAERLRQALLAARSERMLREFASLVEALTAEVPLVLVLEDLHWCDPSTVDLLALLANRPESARLLIIGTYRPAEAAVHQPALPQMVRALQLRRHCARLPLHELDEADLRDYLESRFPGAALPPTLTAVLHRYTDGNPLFVNAAVDHMLSRGWILDTAPGWAFAPHPEQLDLGIPDDARRLIATQLEGLAPVDRSLLDAASAIGAEFTAPLLAAALEARLDDVEARCDDLARLHRYLRAAGSGEWPDGSLALHYAFPHELYRQAIYDALPAGKRQRLHQRIGEALEAAHGSDVGAVAGELAEHFARSGDVRRALRYLQAAAQRASRRDAGREAIAFLEMGLTLVERLPADAAPARELALRLQLWPLLRDHAGVASQRLSDNCARADLLARTAGSAADRFEALFALVHVATARADAAAPGLVDAVDRAALALDDRAIRLRAASARLRVALYRGDFAQTLDVADRVPDVVGLEQLTAFAPDLVLLSRSHYAAALWFLGRVDDALAHQRETLDAAERSGVSLFARSAALGWWTFLLVMYRDAAGARASGEQVLRLTTENGFPFWGAIALSLVGWAEAVSDEVEAGIAHLREACAALAATGGSLFAPNMQTFLAEAYLRSGAIESGLEAAELGLRLATETLDRFMLPELWRLKGELLLAGSRGTAAQAVHCFEQAVTTAQASGARSLELRAVTSQVRLQRASGGGETALSRLAALCEWFGAQGDSPDLADARALLAAPRGGVRRPAGRRAPRD